MESKRSRVEPNYEETDVDSFTAVSGQVFAWIFIVEFALKVVAQGFVIHKKSYLRDWWNKLDFLIVVVSIAEFSGSQDEEESRLTLIRLLRLLKPLRSIKALKTLRFLIQSLLASLAGLLNVFLFLGFVLSIFAVLGVNLFSGDQYKACRATEDVIFPADGSAPYWPLVNDERTLCITSDDCKHLAMAVCGSTWEKAGLAPVDFDGARDAWVISYGIPGFDNFFQALYTVFQVCTLESWAYIMYNFRHSSANDKLPFIFFPIIVIFGAFFTMNLILA